MAKIKDGQNVTLTALQKKMLPHILLPMAEECPTALRYALAKYDANAVTEAYDGLLELEAQALLDTEK